MSPFKSARDKGKTVWGWPCRNSSGAWAGRPGDVVTFVLLSGQLWAVGCGAHAGLADATGDRGDPKISIGILTTT